MLDRSNRISGEKEHRKMEENGGEEVSNEKIEENFLILSIRII